MTSPNPLAREFAAYGFDNQGACPCGCGLIPTAQYLRQSEALNDDETAVTRQRELNEADAPRRGLHIVATFIDNDTSATSRKPRPNYELMLEAWRRGEFEAIICYDLDRLYRHPRDLEDLIDLAEGKGGYARPDRKPLKLFTVGGDADLSADNGRFFARMKAVVSRSEIERKSKRQKDANAYAAKHGAAYWRRRPFGFELDGTHREEEAAAVRAAYEAIIAGDRLSEIKRRWDELGLRTPETAKSGGNLFSITSLGKLLRSHRFAGIRYYEGVEYPGTWEPVVDEATWRTAISILDQRAAKAGPGGPRNMKRLLAGIIKCGTCGGNVTSFINYMGKPTYRCSSVNTERRTASPCASRLAEPIDEAVRAYVLSVLSAPEARELLLDKKRVDLKALGRERDQIRAEMQELATDHYQRKIPGTTMPLVPRAVFIEQQEIFQARLARLEMAMVDAGKREVLGDLVGADDVAAKWDAKSFDRKRQVIRMLCTVRLISAGRGDPSQRGRPPVEITPVERV